MASAKPKWKAATRLKLHAFRNTHPNDPTVAQRLPTREVAWEIYRQWTQNGDVTCEPEHEAIVQRLGSQLSTSTPPAFEPALELYRAAYLIGLAPTDRSTTDWAGWEPERALMALWAHEDMSAVLDVLTRPGTFWMETGSTWVDGTSTPSLRFTSASPSEFADPQPEFSIRSTFSIARGLWYALRLQVDAFDEASFKAANAAAHATRAKLPPEDSYGRAFITYAFARDPHHASEELRAPERHQGIEAGMVLLASGTLDSAQVMADRLSNDVSAAGELAFDLVEVFGAAARPVLEACVASVSARKRSASLQKALLKPLEDALKVLS